MIKLPNRRTAASLAACATIVTTSSVSADEFCPEVYDQGVMNTGFNPAFIDMDTPESGGNGFTVTSFVNFGRMGRSPDLAARVNDLGSVPLASSYQPPYFFGPPGAIPLTPGIDVITNNAPATTWPNEAVLAPEGMFDFPAVVIPQGFHVTLSNPGRLTIINLDDNSEYLVSQSTQGAGGFTFPYDPNNSPRFYHRVLFEDMDNDGDLDLVTVRAGFRLTGAAPYPPFSELVWFKNPGAALDPATPWDEVILYAGANPNAPFNPSAPALGPDIHLAAYHYAEDAEPLIVATHFFSGGYIALYGPPPGQTWAQVNAFFNPARAAIISTGQGLPFDVQVVDLNLDGKPDVLATNHQADNCTFPTAVPGRIYALEGPALGAGNDPSPLFAPWTTHILKDDIYPQPSFPGATVSRLAPGRAQAFHTKKSREKGEKPWIVSGGDEAAKVWVLRPKKKDDPASWEYQSSVVFDINTHPAYASIWQMGGTAPTQTNIAPAGPPVTISTIGAVGVGYDDNNDPTLYIPVFEGRKIHVISFAEGAGAAVTCSADTLEACN